MTYLDTLVASISDMTPLKGGIWFFIWIVQIAVAMGTGSCWYRGRSLFVGWVLFLVAIGLGTGIGIQYTHEKPDIPAVGWVMMAIAICVGIPFGMLGARWSRFIDRQIEYEAKHPEEFE